MEDGARAGQMIYKPHQAATTRQQVGAGRDRRMAGGSGMPVVRIDIRAARSCGRAESRWQPTVRQCGAELRRARSASRAEARGPGRAQPAADAGGEAEQPAVSERRRISVLFVESQTSPPAEHGPEEVRSAVALLRGGASIVATWRHDREFMAMRHALGAPLAPEETPSERARRTGDGLRGRPHGRRHREALHGVLPSRRTRRQSPSGPLPGMVVATS